MVDRAKVMQRFGHAATRYNAHAELQQEILRASVARAEHGFEKADIILDVGAGTGQLASLIQKPVMIIPCDIAPSMCVQTGSSMAVAADFHHLPFKDASVDVYFSSLAWQWAGDISQVCAEAARVLKPGGVLVVSTLTQGTLVQLAHTMSKAGQETRMLSYCSEEKYQSALVAAGFGDIELQSTTIEKPYDSVLALLHSMKAIGASYSHASTPLTRTMLQQIEAHYPKHESAIMASWQWSMFMARKRA